MRKSAKQWYESRKSYCTTWEEFVENFAERFLPKDSKYKFLNDFSSAKQRTKETASEFIDRVFKLHERTKMNISEEQVIVVIKKGLNVKQYRHQISSMTSHREVIAKVQSLEEYDLEDDEDNEKEVNSKKVRGRSPENKLKSPKEDIKRSRDRDFRRDKPQQYLRNDFRRVPQQQFPQRQPNNTGFRPECANCGQLGHIYRNCRLPLDRPKVDAYIKAYR